MRITVTIAPKTGPHYSETMETSLDELELGVARKLAKEALANSGISKGAIRVFDGDERHPADADYVFFGSIDNLQTVRIGAE